MDMDLIFVGLNSDSRGIMFPSIVEVVPFAGEIEVLAGTCKECGGVSQFTQRLQKSPTLFVPGGANSYAALCGACYKV